MTRLILTLTLVLTLAACSTSCSHASHELREAASDVVDCMKPELLDAGRELTSVLDAALVTVLSDDGKVDREGFKAITRDLTSDAAGCAVATAIARLAKPRDQGPPYAAPLAVDVADLEASWADVRRERFGGRAFVVGDS